MDSEPFKSVTLYDRISLFELGMNSGVDPLLLEKSQLSFGNNLTVRKGFLTDRPPFTKAAFTYIWPSDEVQTAIEEGLFQGAGYYQPDSGNQSLFASISGRLFQFVVNGNEITVIERTIPGDPNPATATQAWMWQAENYLIVTDGLSLPIFFDGVSSRRSFGPSVLLATLDAGPYTAPAIGSQITVTLTAPYTGPFNVPVLLHGEFYQPIENPAGYQFDATNITDVPGNPINIGDEMVIRGDVFGVVDTPRSVMVSGAFAALTLNFVLTLTLPWTYGVGDGAPYAIVFGKLWRVKSFNGTNVLIENLETVVLTGSENVAHGEVIIRGSQINPNVVVGSVEVPAIAPATGGTVQLTLNNAYALTPNQEVFFGDRQYTASNVPPAAPGTSITLINLTDTDQTAGGLNSLPILSAPELPPGRMGAYGLGQVWMSLVDGLSFIVGDMSRGPSGTPANNYRDAVLKTTELFFRGGNFAIPGAGNVITAIVVTANLDLSMGQGSVQICTAAFMASCLAPIDFTTLPSVGTPILTFSLIGSGPLAQNSTIRVNSDIFFRSIPGLGSLILGRRDFSTPGNTPISDEVIRVLDLDDKKLLSYGSAVVFDNRYLITASPQASSQGVFHAGLIAMNLDPLSGIRGKLPPVYDGLWTGLNTLQLVSGTFNGTERAFAFTFNVALSKIELYELLPTGTEHFDDGNNPITWSFETPVLFNNDVKPNSIMASLRDGEFAVSDVVGTVRFAVYYRSDNYPSSPSEACWTPWHSFSICADTEGKPQYFPRLGLGEPSSAPCDPTLKTPLRDGYTYQLKFLIVGHLTFLRARFAAVTIPTPKFQRPICDSA